MKKIKAVIIAVICLIFTGCGECGEKRIVNFITVDREKISVYYSDFSDKKPAYIKVEKENKGIKNTLTDILSEDDYDLKLCRFAVVNSDIADNSMNELFFALTDNRFAPDIIILEGDTNLKADEYQKINKSLYPVYNYNIKNGSLSGIVEQLEGKEKKIIINDKLYKKLNEQQGFVFDVLNNSIKNEMYVIENNGEIYSAELENINRCYSVTKDTLCINITATIKSYKGAPSNVTDKERIEKLVEADIKKNAGELLRDKTITENFNLLLNEKTDDFKKIEIDVNII